MYIPPHYLLCSGVVRSSCGFSPSLLPPEEFHWQIREDKGSLVLRNGKYSEGLFFTVLLENVGTQLSWVLSHVVAAHVTLVCTSTYINI